MTKEDIRNLFGDNKQAYIDFETKVNTLPQIRSLEDKFNKLQSGFCYVEAMKLRKRINDIKYQAAKSLIEENDKRERKMNLLSLSIPEDDKKKILEIGVCLDIVADAMETFVMDVDDILRKSDPTLSFEELVNTKKAISLLRNQLRFSGKDKEINLRNYEAWGDNCDELIEEIRERSRKIQQEVNKARSNNDSFNTDNLPVRE